MLEMRPSSFQLNLVQRYSPPPTVASTMKSPAFTSLTLAVLAAVYMASAQFVCNACPELQPGSPSVGGPPLGHIASQDVLPQAAICTYANGICAYGILVRPCSPSYSLSRMKSLTTRLTVWKPNYLSYGQSKLPTVRATYSGGRGVVPP